MTNSKIAGVYQISTRRLQQLWARYRSTGQMPTLHKPGRPSKPPDPTEEELVLQAWNKHHWSTLSVSSLYWARVSSPASKRCRSETRVKASSWIGSPESDPGVGIY